MNELKIWTLSTLVNWSDVQKDFLVIVLHTTLFSPNLYQNVKFSVYHGHHTIFILYLIFTFIFFCCPFYKNSNLWNLLFKYLFMFAAANKLHIFQFKFTLWHFNLIGKFHSLLETNNLIFVQVVLCSQNSSFQFTTQTEYANVYRNFQTICNQYIFILFLKPTAANNVLNRHVVYEQSM